MGLGGSGCITGSRHNLMCDGLAARGFPLTNRKATCHFFIKFLWKRQKTFSFAAKIAWYQSEIVVFALKDQTNRVRMFLSRAGAGHASFNVDPAL